MQYQTPSMKKKQALPFEQLEEKDLLTVDCGGGAILQQAHIPSMSQDAPFFASNQLPSHPEEVDFDRTKTWDNFQLDVAAELNGLCWTGAFEGPFKEGGPRPEVDFLVEIYADNNDAPAAAPLFAWDLDGGNAGTDDGNDVRTSQREDEFIIRNGQVFDYSANPLPSPAPLDPGQYWLSITAKQTFPNPDPITDPENGFFDPAWGWHVGEGSDASALNSYGDDVANVAQDFSFRLLEVGQSVPYDLTADGAVDLLDVERLQVALQAADDAARFDLNNDNAVDVADLDFLVEDVLQGRKGDTDLDGDVDFTDFLALSQSFGQDGPRFWSNGNFNGDDEVSFADFLHIAQQFGK